MFSHVRHRDRSGLMALQYAGHNRTNTIEGQVAANLPATPPSTAHPAHPALASAPVRPSQSRRDLRPMDKVTSPLLLIQSD